MTLAITIFSCSDGEDGIGGVDGINGIDGLNAGLEFLVFAGDITDDEAAAMIVEDFGGNTAAILVINTTNLTKLEFPETTNMVRLKVTNNEKLQSISIPGITAITEEINIASNTALTTVNLDSLTTVGDFYLSTNNALTTINMNVLDRVKEFGIENNPALERISLPALTKVTEEFKIENNDNLSALDISALTTGDELSVRNNEKLSDIDLSNVISIEVILIGSPVLANVNLNNLTTFSNLSISSEATLASIQLSSIQEFTRIRLSRLSTEDIDTIFRQLVSITPAITENQIIVTGTASTQALTYAETLRTNGNTVTITD
ncbi:hypothetical protein GCM10022259_07870 [Aquimarina mytili]